MISVKRQITNAMGKMMMFNNKKKTIQEKKEKKRTDKKIRDKPAPVDAEGDAAGLANGKSSSILVLTRRLDEVIMH